MKGTGRLWFSIAVLVICSCGSTKECTDENEVRVRINSVERTVRDSVFVRDSIFIREKADTVFFTKYRTLYKEKIVRDTVVMCDTLYIERVVEQSQEAGDKGRGGVYRVLMPLIYVLLIVAAVWILRLVAGNCLKFLRQRFLNGL